MSTASQAAYQKLLDSQSLQYGDYNVTKDWMYAINPLAGSAGQSKIIAFNPNDTTQRFGLSDANSAEAQQLQEYLTLEGRKGNVEYGNLSQYFSDFDSTGNSQTGGLRTSIDKYFGASLSDIAEQKRLAGLTTQIQSGQITAQQGTQMANQTQTAPKTVYQTAYDQSKANQTTPGSGQTYADRLRYGDNTPLNRTSSSTSSQFPAPGKTVGDLFTNPHTGVTYNWRTGAIVNDPTGKGASLLPPAVKGVSSGVPSVTNSSFTPPATTSGTANNVYYQSLNQQTQTLQQTLDREYQRQLDTIQRNKDMAANDLQDLRNQQGDIINEQGALAIEEKNAILKELDVERKRFDENYKIVQGLGSQLMNLMTEGNALIMSQKGVTGLGLIRNPRVTETINNITAAAGVIQAGIDVYNGQMNQAQNQLQTATATITSAYTDQIDYYKSLTNFYESMSADKSAELKTLTANEQEFLQAKITMLEANVERVKDTAQAIQNAMMDPDTALAYASAGVTLNDSPEVIAQKLGKYGYSKELADQSNEMASNGYTALTAGKAPAGSEVVTITDSMGKTKTYYKKAEAKSSSGNFNAEVSIPEFTRGFESITGPDNYVDPQEWIDARTLWGLEGGSDSSFVSNFKKYLNPLSYSKAGLKSTQSDEEELQNIINGMFLQPSPR